MAISFRSALANSRSSFSQGQPVMSAWRGGGSTASTSNLAVLTMPAERIAAPCKEPSFATSARPIATKSPRGSAPCRKTEVFPSVAFGINADGFTTVELKWPEDLRKRARGSPSEISSGNPEGRLIRVNSIQFVQNPRRHLPGFCPSHRMPTIRSIHPSIGDAIGKSDAQRKAARPGREPVEGNFPVRFNGKFRQGTIIG